MIGVFEPDISIKIVGNNSDYERLDNAVGVLTEILKAFEKGGGYTSTEQEALRYVLHIIDEIKREEIF